MFGLRQNTAATQGLPKTMKLIALEGQFEQFEQFEIAAFRCGMINIVCFSYWTVTVIGWIDTSSFIQLPYSFIKNLSILRLDLNTTGHLP